MERLGENQQNQGTTGWENMAPRGEGQKGNQVERLPGPGFKEVAYYEMSKTQARAGERASRMGERLRDDKTGEDMKLVLADKAVFGVFDGAGGMGGGRDASRVATDVIEQAVDQLGIDPKSGEDLAKLLNYASRGVDKLNAKNGGHSASTGVLARIIERDDGQKSLAYASVGDSRIYVVDAGGAATQITKDEGFENYITNCLGGSEKMGPWDERTKQFGEISLRDGDRIVLCSDGITGDRGSDLMGPEELAAYVHETGNTAEAAEALVENARKNDDRTAIVVEV